MPANAVDLCLSATVASDLGVADDARLQRAVTAASRAVARYCGRPFERATVTEYPPGYGRPLLLLERAPIVSVASVTEAGVSVPSTSYEFLGQLANAGMLLRREGVWMDTGVHTGRITSSPDVNFGRSDGIVVVYSAGFVTPGQRALDAALTVTLPEDVQEAAVITAADFYRRQTQDSNVASESLGDWSVSYAGTNTAIGRGVDVLPSAAVLILAPYRSLRVS